MHVVATAGHVDHGKSTLVRALTGMEPDRWAEERRRGMTIDLGYAWTTLPSGAELAFVDVPGHHRFVANMLAGVGPVPAVLFVVAADEGWRQQSAEHLAAVDALGVRHGLLAVTRADLADPAPAIAAARTELARSSLGTVAAVAVSGQTRVGVPALRAALDRLVAELPQPVATGRLRLWIDRAFSIRGAGTVVTGTLGAGTISAGDVLQLAPDGLSVRVRELQTLNRRVEAARAVCRVAVNLRGIDLADVRRGDALVSPGAWKISAEIDVRLTRAAPPPLPATLTLHIGSAGVPARLRPLGPDTARLTLARALPLAPQDRGLLRDPGGHRIAAGVVVLDVAPPPLRRRGAASARATELAAVTGHPDPVREVTRRGAATRDELAAIGALPVLAAAPAELISVGNLLVAPGQWDRWRAALFAAVDEHRRAAPLEPGLPTAAARRATGVPNDAVLTALVRSRPGLETIAGRVRRTGAAPMFPPQVRAALDSVRAGLARAPYAAPEAGDLVAAGLGPRELAAAVTAGLLLSLGADIYLLPGADVAAKQVLAGLPQPFTLSQARQALGTTRRVAVPLLEHLDRRGLTRRIDAVHREVISGTPDQSGAAH